MSGYDRVAVKVPAATHEDIWRAAQSLGVTVSQLIDKMLDGNPVVPLLRRDQYGCVRDLDRAKFATLVRQKSARELSDTLNVDRSAISNWRRKIKVPTVGNFVAVCSLLGVDAADYILPDDECWELLIGGGE